MNLEEGNEQAAFEMVKKTRLRVQKRRGDCHLTRMGGLPHSPHSSSFPGREPVQWVREGDPAPSTALPSPRWQFHPSIC